MASSSQPQESSSGLRAIACDPSPLLPEQMRLLPSRRMLRADASPFLCCRDELMEDDDLMFLLGGCDSLSIISFMQTFAFRKASVSAALLRLERELKLSKSMVVSFVSNGGVDAVLSALQTHRFTPGIVSGGFCVMSIICAESSTLMLVLDRYKDFPSLISLLISLNSTDPECRLQFVALMRHVLPSFAAFNDPCFQPLLGMSSKLLARHYDNPSLVAQLCDSIGDIIDPDSETKPEIVLTLVGLFANFGIISSMALAAKQCSNNQSAVESIFCALKNASANRVIALCCIQYDVLGLALDALGRWSQFERCVCGCCGCIANILPLASGAEVVLPKDLVSLSVQIMVAHPWKAAALEQDMLMIAEATRTPSLLLEFVQPDNIAILCSLVRSHIENPKLIRSAALLLSRVASIKKGAQDLISRGVAGILTRGLHQHKINAAVVSSAAAGLQCMALTKELTQQMLTDGIISTLFVLADMYYDNASVLSNVLHLVATIAEQGGVCEAVYSGGATKVIITCFNRHAADASVQERCFSLCTALISVSNIRDVYATNSAFVAAALTAIYTHASSVPLCFSVFTYLSLQMQISSAIDSLLKWDGGIKLLLDRMYYHRLQSRICVAAFDAFTCILLVPGCLRQFLQCSGLKYLFEIAKLYKADADVVHLCLSTLVSICRGWEISVQSLMDNSSRLESLLHMSLTEQVLRDSHLIQIQLYVMAHLIVSASTHKVCFLLLHFGERIHVV
jgi:hypothetical protein